MFAGRRAGCRSHSRFGVPQRLPGDGHRYTGHLRDAESGNDFAGARYYTTARGRWLSVDPVLGDLANPQRLKRYADVLNNPVSLIDADGRGEELPPPPANPFYDPFQTPLWISFWLNSQRFLGVPVGTLPPIASTSWASRATATAFQFAAFAAREYLENNLRLQDPDCREIFDVLGVKSELFLKKVKGVIFLDGTISTRRIEDLVDPPYARTAGVTGWTAADLFRKGFPDPQGGGNRYINAWTPPQGPYIFLYGQGGVLGSPLPPVSGVSPATIAHEIFHKLKQYDEDLKRAEFGIDQQDPSGKFTEYFRSKCL